MDDNSDPHDHVQGKSDSLISMQVFKAVYICEFLLVGVLATWRVRRKLLPRSYTLHCTFRLNEVADNDKLRLMMLPIKVELVLHGGGFLL